MGFNGFALIHYQFLLSPDTGAVVCSPCSDGTFLPLNCLTECECTEWGRRRRWNPGQKQVFTSQLFDMPLTLSSSLKTIDLNSMRAELLTLSISDVVSLAANMDATDAGIVWYANDYESGESSKTRRQFDAAEEGTRSNPHADVLTYSLILQGKGLDQTHTQMYLPTGWHPVQTSSQTQSCTQALKQTHTSTLSTCRKHWSMPADRKKRKGDRNISFWFWESVLLLWWHHTLTSTETTW